MRRRGVGGRRPSLLGTAARTAVVASTANAVGRGAHAREVLAAQQQQDNTRAAVADALAAQRASEASAIPPERSAPSRADGVDVTIARLKELAALRDEGILTDAEFEAQKAKLLSS